MAAKTETRTGPKGYFESSGRFPAGADVLAFPLVHDRFVYRGQKPVAKATVRQDGTYKLIGLEPGTQYFIASEVDGEWRAVAVVAHPKPDAEGHDARRTRLVAEAKAASEARQKVLKDDPLAGSPARGFTDESLTIVEGARSSGTK